MIRIVGVEGEKRIRQAAHGEPGSEPGPASPAPEDSGGECRTHEYGERYYGGCHSRTWDRFTGDARHGGPTWAEGFPVYGGAFDDRHAVCGYDESADAGENDRGYVDQCQRGGSGEWVEVPVTTP